MRDFHVHPASEPHGETISAAGEATERGGVMEPTEQGVHEGCEYLPTSARESWTKHVGVVAKARTAHRFVRSTKISGDAKPVVKVSANGGVPAVQTGTVQVCVLITSKDLCFGVLLGSCCQ